MRIHGWSHDPRELYEIEEAVELLRQFVAHGGMSPLEVSERHPAVLERKFENPRSPTSPPLGSFTVWRIVNGHVGKGLDSSDTAYRRMLAKFYSDLEISNGILDNTFNEREHP